MKTSLGDLNTHLFAQLERLNDEEITGDKLIEEINRAKSITSVAHQIIAAGSLVLKAKQLADDHMNADTVVPKMLEG